MSLFSTTKAPEENPAVKAARQRQETLAANDLTSQIQDDLRRRTRTRLQQYGLLPNTGLAGVRAAFAGA